ncbi:MAG: ATP-binding cassette domain-containing protein [Actinomycetota bacterium]|nr:ATP-binding cassette domain-containing protein [Actinomycetota bacterium]
MPVDDTTYPFVPLAYERLDEEEARMRSRAFLQSMQGRRTVRRFSAEPVPFELIANAVLTAGTAPSGAHQQPWTFVVVTDQAVKQRIRVATEKEEWESYHGRMSPEWIAALLPLGTDWVKEHITTAPYLIVVFEQIYGLVPDGQGGERQVKHYYARESIGIAAGLLLAWLRAFGEFGATVVLAYHPYSVPVFTYVQFGGTGITSTLTAVGASLGAAAVVLLLAAYLPRLRRRHPVPDPLPEPSAPSSSTSPRLTFDLAGRLGSFQVEVAHTTTSGRHLAILGASGSGKSLTLRMLAGLIRPTGGQVCLDGADVTSVAPEGRGFGYVPQDAALLPHLPVWHQVMFGVGTEAGLAAHWIRRLGLTGLEARLPSQLSSGQRRRVAIARALARNPRLLLLDEPFTGLDAPVRDELRHELRRLQRDTAITTVIVTHDPVEAALLADEVLVLDFGRVEQGGPQPAVFAHPASPTAARLLGIRNLHVGQRAGTRDLVAGRVRISFGASALPTGTTLDAELTWCIRPEHLRLDDLVEENTDGHPGTVNDVVALGAVDEVLVALDGGPELTAQTPAGDHPELGARCRLTLPPASVIVWPGRNIPTPAGDSPGRRRTMDFTMPDLYDLSSTPPPR